MGSSHSQEPPPSTTHPPRAEQNADRRLPLLPQDDAHTFKSQPRLPDQKPDAAATNHSLLAAPCEPRPCLRGPWQAKNAVPTLARRPARVDGVAGFSLRWRECPAGVGRGARSLGGGFCLLALTRGQEAGWTWRRGRRGCTGLCRGFPCWWRAGQRTVEVDMYGWDGKMDDCVIRAVRTGNPSLGRDWAVGVSASKGCEIIGEDEGYARLLTRPHITSRGYLQIVTQVSTDKLSIWLAGR